MIWVSLVRTQSGEIYLTNLPYWWFITRFVKVCEKKKYKIQSLFQAPWFKNNLSLLSGNQYETWSKAYSTWGILRLLHLTLYSKSITQIDLWSKLLSVLLSILFATINYISKYCILFFSFRIHTRFSIILTTTS